MGGFIKKTSPDFKGIKYSKIGYFKEVRHKIKELERLNVELGRRKSRLEAIFNSISDGLTILDSDFNIVSVNHVQQSMFPHVSLVGKKCYKAFFSKDEICVNCLAAKAFKFRRSYQGEKVIKLDGGKFLYLDMTVSPIVEPLGDVCEIILLMRNVTEKKEYEHKVMHADRMTAIGFLAAGIAHEINNPLTSIAGFAEGLFKKLNKLDKNQFEKHRANLLEYLKIIMSETYRCQTIVERLHDFSRDSDSEIVPLEVGRLIQDCLMLIRQRAKDQGLKLVFKNDLNKGFERLRGREAQIKHLFLSLLIKMLNSVDNKGELVIRIFNQADQIVITISDGHAQDVIEFDTEAIDALDIVPLGEEKEHQNFVDLSICYTIVEYHMGTISRYITHEGGEVFVLNFPVCFESSQ